MHASRRAVLSAAVAGIGAAGLHRAEASQPVVPQRDQQLPTAHDSVVHAVRRLSFGLTPSLIAHVRDVGLNAWLDEQLAMTTDAAGDIAAAGTTTLPLPYLATSMATTTAGRDAVHDLQVATFARAAWGDAQVRELLVELWSNHLSIAADQPDVAAHKVIDDRDVIRKHALGRFSDMLVASAQSPAMLIYLDGAKSHGLHPNENYARELLELHTVGVHAGYTARDVKDAARALTGLTVDSNTGEFAYRPEWHVPGRLRVLGWTNANTEPARGLDVAISLLRYLAMHPATARNIATKLVRRLVADAPPSSLVSSAARVYLANASAIPPVVRHIVDSREFAQSAGHKSQRPFDWATAAVRALQLQPEPTLAVNGNGVHTLLAQLGQVPFGWHPPNGYPDTAVAWASTATVLSRWNAAQALVNGGVAGIKPPDVDALVGTPVPATAGGLVDRLVGRLLAVPVRAALRTAVLRSAKLTRSHPVDQATVRALTPQLAALILSSPEAQVR
ncbi:MAG: hypothetical protein QOE05_2093 [Actinomycetota bacterium]|nr:hypothetical protein [Actinomycetota bacterium]